MRRRSDPGGEWAEAEFDERDDCDDTDRGERERPGWEIGESARNCAGPGSDGAWSEGGAGSITTWNALSCLPIARGAGSTAGTCTLGSHCATLPMEPRGEAVVQCSAMRSFRALETSPTEGRWEGAGSISASTYPCAC